MSSAATHDVEVALRVKASRERAFDVFVREIEFWSRPNDLFRFTRSFPGRMAFEPWLGGRLTETDPQGRAFEVGRIHLPGARREARLHLAAGEFRRGPMDRG
jgi:hypothetical protein